MIRGSRADEAFEKGLDTYLATVTDHGFNASTFTARVVASTRAGLISSVLAALCAGVVPRQVAADGDRDSTASPAATARRPRRARPGAICAPSVALRELASRDASAARAIATARGLAGAEELAKVLQHRVDRIVLRACASEPSHRHESAAALGVEVRAAL
jgi:hypothetical protein